LANLNDVAAGRTDEGKVRRPVAGGPGAGATIEQRTGTAMSTITDPGQDGKSPAADTTDASTTSSANGQPVTPWDTSATGNTNADLHESAASANGSPADVSAAAGADLAGTGDNGQPAGQGAEPSSNGTGHGTDNAEVSPWREVTAEDSCRVPGCGATSGCKVDLKHHRAACLKVGGPQAVVKTGADGLTYHVHSLCDESDQVIQPIPPQLVQFINALFAPDDWVLIRPIETWTEGQRKCSRVAYKHVVHMKAKWLTERASWWTRALHRAKVERANLFFGVCPRFGDKFFDRAFQGRCVRVLWADLDHCTPEGALQRCEKAGLPRPSVVVRSGHGTHLYWILAEPSLIDDASKPPAIYTEFVMLPDGRKKPRHFIKLSETEKVYEYDTDLKTGGNSKTKNIEWPDELSEKAKHIQAIVQGIATAIGGDHTHDLARILYPAAQAQVVYVPSISGKPLEAWFFLKWLCVKASRHTAAPG
jgi:hypothetical protein